MAGAAEPMRDRILAAAIEVIRERGIVAATTKEIARRARVSEGSLYNHFANKTALFATALAEVTGTARAAMARLLDSAGRGTVEGNLARLAADMIRFYGELLPMVGPVLADPELIAWLQDDGPAKAQREAAAKARGRAGTGQDGDARPPGSPGGPPAGPPGGAVAGPVLGHAALIGYLEAERGAGRLAATAPSPFLAVALLGACQQHAFLVRLAGPEPVATGAKLPPEPEEFAADLVRTVLAGHLPG
ncbi:TetR/AcrR family transcriptional regulator [Actinomadura roseirufa]|uniref:TetR/AcrR family transcriptional regulator n=1 Tax=Actinomadura roseirufa TaxID=2094049 RepID=UPI00104124BA|nr:TetR/AcrR family transcriptional regulator [Actinomadura roseirufa]